MTAPDKQPSVDAKTADGPALPRTGNNQQDMSRTAAAITCLLGLTRTVVAVDLARTKEAFAQLQIPELKTALPFCLMVRLASMGYLRKANGSHFRCRGSAETFRFVEPGDEQQTGERMLRFGLYANRETARLAQTTMARLPEPCYGVALSPLAACSRPPATVVLLADAYQTMRVVQAWAYHHGPVNHVSLFGNRGMCAECVAMVLNTGKLHLSPLCANTRHIAAWADHEMGIGFPGFMLETILDGLVKTVPAVEPLRRREAIEKRCVQAGIKLLLPDRKPYFIHS